MSGLLCLFMVCVMNVGAWGQSITCYPTNEQYATGYTSTTVKTSGEMHTEGDGGVQGWMKFNLSNVNIPSNAAISSISLHFYNTSTNVCWVKLTQVSSDPVTAAPNALYNQITDESVNYYTSTYISGLSTAGWKEFVLSDAAVNAVMTALNNNTGYFTIGFYEYETSSNYYLYTYGYDNSTYKPYITINYVSTHTLTYDVSSNCTGTVTPSTPPTGTTAISAIVTSETPRCSNMSYFVGWNTAADGTGTSYHAGDVVDLGGANVTLYAQYSNSLVYCSPSFSSTTATYYISKFVTTGGSANISNESDARGTNGYSDFKSKVVTTSAGSTINFTITIAGGGTHGSAIWIDWNNDGVFDESERVYHTSSYTSSPHAGSFTVPADAITGSHIMRVMSDYYDSDPEDPCAGNTGEVEDYTINIIAPTPHNLTYNTTATCTGTASTAPTGVTNAITATVTSTIPTCTTKPYFLGWNTASDGTGAMYHAGDVVNLRLANVTLYAIFSSTLDYCHENIFSSTTATYYISNFETTGGSTNISNASNARGTNGYTDFTNKTLTAAQGANINFTITISGSSTYGSAIWVDWNNDGDFDEDGEKVYVTVSYASSPHSGSFMIPADATAGNHRMRVLIDYLGSAPNNPCSASTGEVEDYTLNVFVPTAHTLSYNTTTNCTGGSASSAPASVTAITATVTSETPTCSTLSNFVGWNTAANGSGTWYYAGQTVSLANSNVTLYAQYKACTDFTIGTSTNNSYIYAPVYGSSSAYNSYTQQMYLASELTAAGATEGPINSIAFRYYGTSNMTVSSTIYIAQTTVANLTSAWVTGLTQVYSGSITFSPGWVNIDLATPYEWDGTSNIVVAMNNDITSSLSSNVAFYYGTTTSNLFRYYYSSSTIALSNKVPTTETGHGANRPVIRFCIETCEEPNLAFSTSAVTCNINATPTKPTLTNNSGMPATYTSSDVSVATVNASTGDVTIVGGGTTTITARVAKGDYCAKSVSYTLTVTCITPTLSFAQSSLTYTTADNGTHNNPNPLSNPDGGTITYSSSNTNVATVNASTGALTTRTTTGQTTITATFSKSGYCPKVVNYVVYVNAAASVCNDYQIGTGTKYQNYAPFYPYYKYNYTQQIYSSNELFQQGILRGSQIKSISFYYRGAYATTRIIDVYLNEVSTSYFVSNYDWKAQGTRVVQNYNYALNDRAGWYTITFTTPYTYNGGNIVVTVDDNTGSYYNSDRSVFSYTTTANNTCLYLYDDDVNFSAPINYTLGYTNQRPNVIFNACAAILTYDTNANCSGSASTAPDRQVGYGNISITDNIPSCSTAGSMFIGWTTDQEGTGTLYQPGATFNLTRNTTLYAQYRDCSGIEATFLDGDAETVDGKTIYYYNACNNSTVQMKGTTEIASEGGVSSWRWSVNPHDGDEPDIYTYNTTVTEKTQNYNVSEATGHDVTLTVTRADGCPSYAYGRIRVSGGLIPSVSSYDAGQVCIGRDEELTVGSAAEGAVIVVEPESVNVTANLGAGEEVFLPDGPNCTELGTCYESSVTFYDFVDGDKVRSANDVKFLKINMEHSYIGDLNIELICPNGHSVVVVPDVNTSHPYDWPYFALKVTVSAKKRYKNGECTPGNYIDNNNRTYNGWLVVEGTTYSITSNQRLATAFLESELSAAVSAAAAQLFAEYNNSAVDWCDENYYYDVYSVDRIAAQDNSHVYMGYCGLGIPNINDNTDHFCDSSYNKRGIGWDYCWSNNTEYSYASSTNGYIYETANHQRGTTEYFVAKPSNMANMTQIYHPYQSFENLIGCPLNGEWTIRVCDTWNIDNGYVFNWELSLSEDIVPDPWYYTVQADRSEIADCDNDDIASVSGTSMHIAPTATSQIGAHSCDLYIYDNFGCAVTPKVPISYSVYDAINANVTGQSPICLASTVELSVGGTTPQQPGTTYVWDDGSTSIRREVQPFTSTTYEVTVTDANHCSASKTKTININQPARQENTNYFVWTGLKGDDPTNWSEITNWAQYDVDLGHYKIPEGLPTSVDNIYVIDYNCSTVDNQPHTTATSYANDLHIGTGMSVTSTSEKLNIYGDFDNVGTFSCGEGTLNFKGSADQDVTNALTVYNVNFDQTSKYKINVPSMTINNMALFSKGIAYTDMTFVANAVSEGANLNSFVDGQVYKQVSSREDNFEFPTGNDNVMGTVKVNKLSRNADVRYHHSSSDNGDGTHGFTTDDMPRWWNPNDMCDGNGVQLDHISNYEYWNINTTENLTVTLTSKASTKEEHFSTPSDVTAPIYGVIYSGDCWMQSTSGYVTAENSGKDITVTGVSIPPVSSRASGPSITGLGSTVHNSLLPIELVDFTAVCDGGSALVEWTTASERENDYFVLERSADAVNFTEVTRIAGAGNSIDMLSYSYYDNDMFGGDNYYRLIQVDYDGTTSSSEIIVVRCKDAAEGEPIVAAFPNPFNGDLMLRLENFDNKPAEIEIFDMLGKLIATEKVDAPQNSYETTLHLQNLAPATYNLRVTSDDTVIVKQVIKQ